MPLPTWIPGEVLAAADVNSYFVPTAVVKPSTTARASNTTLTADPALTINLAAGGLYEIRCMIFYNGGNAVGYLSWDWTVPSTGSFVYLASYAAQGGGSDTGYSIGTVAGSYNASSSVNGPAWTSGTSNPWCCYMTGLANGGTGGALTFNWAQTASNGTATAAVSTIATAPDSPNEASTSVMQNSYIVATRVAT